MYNPYFQDALSENEADFQGVVNTQESWIFFTNSGAEGTFEMDKKVAKISTVARVKALRNITIEIGATSDKGWKSDSENERRNL